MHQRNRILFQEYGTTLCTDENGSLVLNVLCGRVGQFGVEFALNRAESQEYARRGDIFIKELARAVQADCEPFVARGRTC